MQILSFNEVANAATRCADIFGTVQGEVERSAVFNKDFGPGVFVQKVGRTEFRIEPPPIVANSARAAQLKLGELAGREGNDKFTIVFLGLSEGDVYAFKSMLQRDQRLEGDDRISAILLGTENREASSKQGYENNRVEATVARDRLLRRYRWENAVVRAEISLGKTPGEVYKLTVVEPSGTDSFLLQLRLKAKRFIKNRSAEVGVMLGSKKLHNATAEQMAHTVISELKNTDSNIMSGTLKVMAGDFIIARNP